MSEASATDYEVLATLLRISERLETSTERICERLGHLETIEELLRDFVEQIDETERRWQRCLAALSLAAGNNAPHDD